MQSFTDSGLSENLLKAISDLGFETPTPIQTKTIPALLAGNKDLIALAQTGTGKTAAFGLPIIEMTDMNSSVTQTLVLCPTRELCIQITNDLKDYSKYINNLKVTAVYGGSSIENQIRDLKYGSQIVVGTPGRVLDLIERGKLKVTGIKTLVLDEADEMLSMGFKDSLDSILENTPEDKQVLLFSATMSNEIRSIAKKYMKKPDEITVGKQNTGAENVSHEFYMVHAKDRYEVLKRVADINPDIYGIIFCRTRDETRHIAEKLIQDGYNADALHGDLSQVQRDQVMNRFRVKHLQILVATDVAARGLDVDDLTHIIKYDLPDDLSIYIHRSGRTGRAGKTGTSIAIIHLREKNKIFQLEQQVGKKFQSKKIPSGDEVCQAQLFSLINKVESVEVDEEKISRFLPEIYKKLGTFEHDDLIKRFVSVEFNRFLEYYKDADDLNIKFNQNLNTYRTDSNRSDSDFRNKRGRRNDIKYSKFNINLGSKSNLTPARIIGMINDALQTRDARIGKIEIFDKNSYFDIESSYEPEIISTMESFKVNGKIVKTQLVIEPQRNRTSDFKSDRFNKSDKIFKSDKFKSNKNNSDNYNSDKNYSDKNYSDKNYSDKNYSDRNYSDKNNSEKYSSDKNYKSDRFSKSDRTNKFENKNKSDFDSKKIFKKKSEKY